MEYCYMSRFDERFPEKTGLSSFIDHRVLFFDFLFRNDVSEITDVISEIGWSVGKKCLRKEKRPSKRHHISLLESDGFEDDA